MTRHAYLIHDKTSDCCVFHSLGFTLIELLCVLAIVGLLSTLAMPVYQNAQSRSQRQLAKVALVKSAQWLEQAAMASGRYPAVLPEAVWRSPEFTYTLTLVSQAQSYVLTATPPIGQKHDTCGALTLDQVGQRGAQGDVYFCWSK
ncbi:MAG: type IV pilin protein [Limnohabitans sp.]